MTPPRTVGRTPYPYDRSGITEEQVRRIARAEARALLASVDARNVYPPRSIPLRTVDSTPVVTALPVEPVADDEVYFDTGDGFLWHFRYLGSQAGAYPWGAVGGQTPLFDEVEADETTTSPTFANLGTDGPVVTVPLPGDYDVRWGAFSTGTTATAIQAIAVKRGTAAADAADSIRQQPPGVSYFSSGQSARHRRMTGLAAGDELRLQYETNAGTATFGDRWITATPIRVRRA